VQCWIGFRGYSLSPADLLNIVDGWNFGPGPRQSRLSSFIVTCPGTRHGFRNGSHIIVEELAYDVCAPPFGKIRVDWDSSSAHCYM